MWYYLRLYLQPHIKNLGMVLHPASLKYRICLVRDPTPSDKKWMAGSEMVFKMSRPTIRHPLSQADDGSQTRNITYIHTYHTKIMDFFFFSKHNHNNAEIIECFFFSKVYNSNHTAKIFLQLKNLKVQCSWTWKHFSAEITKFEDKIIHKS